MARTTRRQRSPWPLAALLLTTLALTLGAVVDAHPVTAIPAPRPGASPTPQETP